MCNLVVLSLTGEYYFLNRMFFRPIKYTYLGQSIVFAV